MTFWIILWKCLFIVGVGIFAGMAVWVTIAGFKDIKSLFAQFEKDQPATSDNQPHDSSDPA